MRSLRRRVRARPFEARTRSQVLRRGVSRSGDAARLDAAGGAASARLCGMRDRVHVTTKTEVLRAEVLAGRQVNVTRKLKCPGGRFLLEGLTPDGLNIRVRCGCKGLDAWIVVTGPRVSVVHLQSPRVARQDDFGALYRPLGNPPATASIGTDFPGGSRP